MGFNTAEVYKYVDVRTNHMKYTDSLLMAKEQEELTPRWIVYNHPYGWWLYIDSDFEEHELEEVFDRARSTGYSQEFIDLYKLARKEGYKFIKFDQDGGEHLELPTFDW